MLEYRRFGVLDEAKTAKLGMQDLKVLKATMQPGGTHMYNISTRSWTKLEKLGYVETKGVFVAITDAGRAAYTAARFGSK